MPDIFETIMHRRSIRRFEPKQIEEAALQQILQAGLYAPSAGGRQGVIFAVCQDKEVNERLGKIKRANSHPRMATATSFVSREQPSIADDPKQKNAFYDALTVITMFAPKDFLFSVDDCAVAAENMMLRQMHWVSVPAISVRAGRPLMILTDRRFCGSGTFPSTTMPSCSFFWDILVRATSTQRPSREKRGA